MNSFYIYLMMQVDDIRCVSMTFCLFSSSALFFFAVGRFLEIGDVGGKNFLQIRRNALRVFVITCLICAFTPSTKTLALMYVLPKLTSPEALATGTAETKEIYALAKKALKKLADDKSKDAAKE